jgi:hypothetical protein
MRVADWTPGLDLRGPVGASCPVYVLKTATDLLGCDVKEKEFALSAAATEAVEKKGAVGTEVRLREQTIFNLFSF